MIFFEKGGEFDRIAPAANFFLNAAAFTGVVGGTALVAKNTFEALGAQGTIPNVITSTLTAVTAIAAATTTIGVITFIWLGTEK